MSAFPLSAYLERIAYAGPLEPAPATLRAMHRAQLHAIPFENLDPFSGLPVSLEPADIVEKIVHRGRGGYCFELNGLFLLALQALGFRTRSLCARGFVADGVYAGRTHQITLVEDGGGPWLADVGFGGNGLVEAIPFELDREFDHGLDRFRLVADATYGYRLEHLHPTGWRPNYAFSLDPYLPADYRALNYFISRSPDSIFTRIPLCVRTTPTERRIIVGNQFKIRTAAGTDRTTRLQTADDLRAVLAAHFGLEVPADRPLPDPAPAPAGMREV